MKGLMSVIVVAAFAASTAQADAIYYFASSQFNTLGALVGSSVTCEPGFPDICSSSLGETNSTSISGFLDLASPIAPNSTGGSNPLNWSFTDGIYTVDSSNGTGSVGLTTAFDGSVSDWGFSVESKGPNYDVSFSGDSFFGAIEFVAVAGETVQGEALTGGWGGPAITASAAPEPGSFTLLAIGAALALACRATPRARNREAGVVATPAASDD